MLITQVIFISMVLLSDEKEVYSILKMLDGQGKNNMLNIYENLHPLEEIKRASILAQ